MVRRGGCLSPECDRVVYARDMCRLHYDRWIRSGRREIGPSERLHQPAKGRVCVVQDCDRPTRSKGMCNLHYGRWRKTGEVGGAESLRGAVNGQICSHDDCDEPVRAKGKCSRHYDREIREAVCATCGGSKSSNAWVQCSACYEAHFESRAEATSRCCALCGETRPMSDFGWRKDGRGRTKPRARCRECERRRAREYARQLPDEVRRERKMRSRAAEKAKLAKNPLRRMYRSVRTSARMLGLDSDAVLEAFDRNGNVCQGCGESGTMDVRGRVHIDHDHDTGEFRGFLCTHCNRALGMVRDRPATLRALAEYLEENPSSGTTRT